MIQSILNDNSEFSQEMQTFGRIQKLKRFSAILMTVNTLPTESLITFPLTV